MAFSPPSASEMNSGLYRYCCPLQLSQMNSLKFSFGIQMCVRKSACVRGLMRFLGEDKAKMAAGALIGGAALFTVNVYHMHKTCHITW